MAVLTPHHPSADVFLHRLGWIIKTVTYLPGIGSDGSNKTLPDTYYPGIGSSRSNKSHPDTYHLGIGSSRSNKSHPDTYYPGISSSRSNKSLPDTYDPGIGSDGSNKSLPDTYSSNISLGGPFKAVSIPFPAILKLPSSGSNRFLRKRKHTGLGRVCKPAQRYLSTKSTILGVCIHALGSRSIDEG